MNWEKMLRQMKTDLVKLCEDSDKGVIETYFNGIITNFKKIGVI